MSVPPAPFMASQDRWPWPGTGVPKRLIRRGKRRSFWPPAPIKYVAGNIPDLSDYFLFVLIDLHSRFVVGWMLTEHENTRLAAHFLRESLGKVQGERDLVYLTHHSRHDGLTNPTFP